MEEQNKQMKINVLTSNCMLSTMNMIGPMVSRKHKNNAKQNLVRWAARDAYASERK